MQSLEPRSPGPAAQRTLRVLTVNAHKGFTAFNRRFILHELRDAVRAVGADIVFLQEVLGAHAGHSLRYADWPATPQYEFLADTIWPQFAYGRNAVYPDGDHGNALLSKFSIKRFSNIDVSDGNGSEKRGLLHCVLALPDGGEVHTLCVHLGLREQQRERQMQRMCRQIAQQVPPGAPLLVAGDFNDWRLRGHALLRREAGLHEVFVTAHGAAAKTFPARWPLLSLDRIYVRNARSQRAVVLPNRPWAHLSDHAPLAAEIAL